MNNHKNDRLTVHGRSLLVRRIVAILPSAARTGTKCVPALPAEEYENWFLENSGRSAILSSLRSLHSHAPMQRLSSP